MSDGAGVDDGSPRPDGRAELSFVPVEELVPGDVDARPGSAGLITGGAVLSSCTPLSSPRRRTNQSPLCGSTMTNLFVSRRTGATTTTSEGR
ncbi:hypothetical protein ACWCP6_25075 [Streptomyces sp. NPDC002004]